MLSVLRLCQALAAAALLSAVATTAQTIPDEWAGYRGQMLYRTSDCTGQNGTRVYLPGACTATFTKSVVKGRPSWVQSGVERYTTLNTDSGVPSAVKWENFTGTDCSGTPISSKVYNCAECYATPTGSVKFTCAQPVVKLPPGWAPTQPKVPGTTAAATTAVPATAKPTTAVPHDV